MKYVIYRTRGTAAENQWCSCCWNRRRDYYFNDNFYSHKPLPVIASCNCNYCRADCMATKSYCRQFVQSGTCSNSSKFDQFDDSMSNSVSSSVCTELETAIEYRDSSVQAASQYVSHLALLASQLPVVQVAGTLLSHWCKQLWRHVTQLSTQLPQTGTNLWRRCMRFGSFLFTVAASQTTNGE